MSLHLRFLICNMMIATVSPSRAILGWYEIIHVNHSDWEWEGVWSLQEEDCLPTGLGFSKTCRPHPMVEASYPTSLFSSLQELEGERYEILTTLWPQLPNFTPITLLSPTSKKKKKSDPKPEPGTLSHKHLQQLSWVRTCTFIWQFK